MSFERSRGKRASLNFPLDQKVFDESAIPLKSLAAKKAVLAAKRPDNLGVHRPGWNISNQSDNMVKFPDRPMMRQLAAFDSHKRADYNYRAEELDWKDTRVYVPKTNKFEYNHRSISADSAMLAAPPHLSRTEYPVNSKLLGKERWDPATGHGGDPYVAEKDRERQRQEQIEAARANSLRHPPKHSMTLIDRETKYMAAQREAKRAQRATQDVQSTFTYSDGLRLQPTASASYCSTADMWEMTRQVPTRKTTTWSLGSF